MQNAAKSSRQRQAYTFKSQNVAVERGDAIALVGIAGVGDHGAHVGNGAEAHRLARRLAAPPRRVTSRCVSLPSDLLTVRLIVADHCCLSFAKRSEFYRECRI